MNIFVIDKKIKTGHSGREAYSPQSIVAYKILIPPFPIAYI